MLGIYNQNGQTGFQYHFALTSHNAAFDPVAAMKFSLEHQNPLVAFAAGGEESVRNGSRFSLVSINDPQVLLWSVKPAEEGIGHGLITRFWNMKNISSQPTVQLHTSIREAWQVSHIETNEKRVPVQRGRFTAPLRAHQLASFRLLF